MRQNKGNRISPTMEAGRLGGSISNQLKNLTLWISLLHMGLQNSAHAQVLPSMRVLCPTDQNFVADHVDTLKEILFPDVLFQQDPKFPPNIRPDKIKSCTLMIFEVQGQVSLSQGEAGCISSVRLYGLTLKTYLYLCSFVACFPTSAFALSSMISTVGFDLPAAVGPLIQIAAI